MVNLPPGVAQTGVSISNKKQKITTGNVAGSMTRGSFQFDRVHTSISLNYSNTSRQFGGIKAASVCNKLSVARSASE